MTPREARYALSEAARTALGADWHAYSAPPESLSVPALVVAPRSPYRVKGTVCDEEVRVTLTLLVNRNASVDGLDLLDDSASVAREAINKADPLISYVESVEDVGLIQEVGGIEYLAATLNVTMEV